MIDYIYIQYKNGEKYVGKYIKKNIEKNMNQKSLKKKNVDL